MKEINVGLFKGRHEMPVNDYIFNESIKDTNDFNGMRKTIKEWIFNHVNVSWKYDIPLNYCGMGDVETLCGDCHINLYVTGLTSAVVEFCRICAKNGISFALMHYDLTTGTYKEQCGF